MSGCHVTESLSSSPKRVLRCHIYLVGLRRVVGRGCINLICPNPQYRGIWCKGSASILPYSSSLPNTPSSTVPPLVPSISTLLGADNSSVSCVPVFKRRRGWREGEFAIFWSLRFHTTSLLPSSSTNCSCSICHVNWAIECIPLFPVSCRFLRNAEN